MTPAPELTRRDRIRNRIAVVSVLAVVWALLWGSFSWANLLGGLVVAAVVLGFFPLPPVTFAGRLHPLGGLWFGLRFLADLVVASVQIGWLAFRFGHRPHGAIIAVQLLVNSDLNLTLVAQALSLIPGSLIVETDRSTGTLYVHLLGVTSLAGVERARRHVHQLEGRLIRAIGSVDELRELAAAGDARFRRPADWEGTSS